MRALKPVFLLLVVTVFCFMSFPVSIAAEVDTLSSQKSTMPLKVNLSGPRFGITNVPENSDFAKDLKDDGHDLTYSQFGWQFEYNASPSNGQIDFMVEVIGLLGGTEMGTIIPNLTSLVGIRTHEGIEFGVGPNLSVDGASLCVSAGKSFDYGGIRIPVNVNYIKGPEGVRISLLTGFALKMTVIK